MAADALIAEKAFDADKQRVERLNAAGKTAVIHAPLDRDLHKGASKKADLNECFTQIGLSR